jgi:ankyrin repeat protein
MITKFKTFELNSEEINDAQLLNNLTDAIENNDIDEVKSIISKNNKILNNKNTHGDTPLNVACYEGNLEIVKLLLNNGADVNNTNSHMNFSPLSVLCYCRDFSKDNLEVLKYLLSIPNVILYLILVSFKM